MPWVAFFLRAEDGRGINCSKQGVLTSLRRLFASSGPNYPQNSLQPNGPNDFPLSRDLMTISNLNWLTATEAASYLKVEARTLLM